MVKRRAPRQGSMLYPQNSPNIQDYGPPMNASTPIGAYKPTGLAEDY